MKITLATVIVASTILTLSYGCAPKIESYFLLPTSDLPEIRSIAIAPITIQTPRRMAGSYDELRELKDRLETLIEDYLQKLGYSVHDSAGSM